MAFSSKWSPAASSPLQLTQALSYSSSPSVAGRRLPVSAEGEYLEPNPAETYLSWFSFNPSYYRRYNILLANFWFKCVILKILFKLNGFTFFWYVHSAALLSLLNWLCLFSYFSVEGYMLNIQCNCKLEIHCILLLLKSEDTFSSIQ